MKYCKNQSAPLFAMGQIYITPGAMNVLNTAEVNNFLYRHCHGDWGLVCAEDAEENWFSLQNGYRLISVYATYDEVIVWVITEDDRSITTVLLPEEY